MNLFRLFQKPEPSPGYLRSLREHQARRARTAAIRSVGKRPWGRL